MGSELIRWVGQLVAMAVVFAILDLLQPEGSLRGVVRTVMGLALVAAVLGPIVGLVEDAAAWRLTLSRWEQEAAAAASSRSPGPVDAEALNRALWQAMLQREQVNGGAQGP